jgi:hypothetical protein
MIEIYAPVATNNITSDPSNWSSMRQPYIFKFIRKDATYTGLISPGGFIALTGLSITGYSPIVGDTITIVVLNQIPRLKAVGKIVSYAGGVLQTDIPYNVNGITTAGNILWGAWERYRVVAKLTGNIPSLGLSNEYELGTIYGTPDAYGVLNMDVSRLLPFMCEKKNLNTFLNANIQDPHGWLRFQMEYEDSFYYQKNISSTTKGTSEDFYGIDGVKQLMSVYGQNYCNYLPELAAAGNYPAKWLTMFVEPTQFIGYPFSLSFILRADSYSHVLITEGFNNANQPQIITNTNLTYYEGLNQINTPEPSVGTDYVYASINYGIAGKINPPSYYYDDELPNEPRVDVKIWGAQVSRTIRVNIDRECKKYPVYLMWKNSLGGWDYWLFDKVNEVQYQSDRGEKYGPYVPYIDAATLRSSIIQASAKRKIIVGDVVTVQVAEALSDIERSTAVYILYDARNFEALTPEYAWMSVDVEPKGITYKSNQGTAQVEFTLVLPELYTVPR